MADTSIPNHYNAAQAAARFSSLWEQQGLYAADPDASGPAYSMIMPPPNVTGALHMGHALNATLQDVLIRYKRMDGFNTVWIPGVDHASIAVHWLVERALAKEGLDKHTLGREKFLERAQAFKEQSQAKIVEQFKTLGISCDWQRLAFTLDADRVKAVREAFVRLYEDGLIYRAERLVNWDPISQTTLSDLEVKHEENVLGELFAFAYKLQDGSGELIVATTRPETMLADTAVAVHPKDPRYAHLIGRTLKHPFSQREIPIVADGILVDPKFGTGAVKVTPAHDFNDFEVGQRHKLPMINMLNPDGTLAENCGDFAGLTVLQARVAVKEKLLELDLVRGQQEHRLSIGRSERSGAIVEPMLSTQWYVRTKPLARPSLAAVEHDATRFVPKNWENTYFSWLRDIRDWCISRQLWWGHRIPAWFCQDCEHVTVVREDPSACEGCQSTRIVQETDILDTWFSSALWPFSTMGWPRNTPDLARWYPTATLVTGFDIIFFWVARMMMFGQYFMGQAPFENVVLHALVRDAKGEKMSKTKGNVVNPLEMIERYGCDAFRFTLVAFAAQGRDVRWDDARTQGYQKFCNKIWQAFRFAMTHIQSAPKNPPKPSLSVWDRWILEELRQTCGKVRDALDSFRFNDASAAIYTFVWDTFCDWYLEISKPTLYAEDVDPKLQSQKQACRETLATVFETVAKLLHPMMPFLSEELWTHLPNTQGLVACATYPRMDDFVLDASAHREAHFVQNVVGCIRRIRAEFGVAPKDQIHVFVQGSETQMAVLQSHADVMLSLCKSVVQKAEQTSYPHAATDSVANAEIFVPLAGLIDFELEGKRLQKELSKVEKEHERIVKQLARPDFLDRAPKDIVEEKRMQQQVATERMQSLTNALARLRA